MQALQDLLNKLSGFIWGEYLLIPLLALTGLYLTIGLRAMPWRYIPRAISSLWQGRKMDPADKGDISPFQALMTALSATVGTGNIAGVATAIHLGGPGAIFWMWVIALFGMATKYSEAVLAVKYREVDELGNHVGGPMYYIKNGLGKNWTWLAMAFALFGMFAAFGIGNLVQSNSVASVLNDNFDIPLLATGLVMAIAAGIVIIGGVRRVGEVAAKLVPFMAIAYVVSAASIILLNVSLLPSMFAMIINDAFTGTAASGGFLGATVWAAIRFGVARGIFSNEAGLGSAPIAHAAAKTDNPVRQGMVAMLGTFIDTIILCTMTALVILLSGLWTSGETSATLSSMAFANGLPGVGSYVVSFSLAIFAFTTILGWSYYGERCAEFIFGVRIILPYRLFWICVIVTGAVVEQINLIWSLADVLNGLMAIPNLIALLLLSPVIFSITREFLSKEKS